MVHYQQELTNKTGDAISALFLSWVLQTHKSEGVFTRTANEIQNETGLTYRQQKRARKIVSDLGIVKITLKGLPAKLYYDVVKQ